MLLIVENGDKNTLIEFRIEFAFTVFNRFGTQRLLPVHRPHKILAGKSLDSIEKVIAEAEEYFVVSDKSF